MALSIREVCVPRHRGRIPLKVAFMSETCSSVFTGGFSDGTPGPDDCDPRESSVGIQEEIVEDADGFTVIKNLPPPSDRSNPTS